MLHSKPGFTLLKSLLLTATTATVAIATICDVSDQGTSFHLQDPAYANCSFLVLHEDFLAMIEEDDAPQVELLLNRSEELFHEGPVLFDEELFFTTNRLGLGNDSAPTWGDTATPSQLDQFIDIYKLDRQSLNLTKVTPSNLPMANGMTKSADGTKILALSQGFSNETASQIFELDPTNTEQQNATVVVGGFYGTSFNSLNDIKVTADNIMFFTDPVYGFEQGFRVGNPALGGNVYRYDASTKSVSIVYTNLQRPNGLALLDERDSGGGCTLFLTDSGFEPEAQTSRGFNSFSDSAVFQLRDNSGTCFEPSSGPWMSQPLMPVLKGIQDGIHIHFESRILYYCDGNGAWFWSLDKYQPLGLIKQPCTQLIASQESDTPTDLFLLAEKELFRTRVTFMTAEDPDAGGSSGGTTTRSHSTVVLLSSWTAMLVLSFF